MISVIIPCFNTNEEIHLLTQASIDSIREAGNGEVEFVIVDNGSTFASGYLRSEADTYIRNKKNLGYPKAVNQGLALATQKIICVANNDIIVANNVFSLGIEALKCPKIGSLHYKMIDYSAQFDLKTGFWETGKERWCTSSFFLIKKEAIPTGGYDENFGMGGYDDWDFWKRVRDSGWLTAYTNASAYKHYGSWTLSKVPESEKTTKNREYFKKKHGRYAEDIWNELYPDQMQANYLEGFE